MLTHLPHGKTIRLLTGIYILTCIVVVTACTDGASSKRADCVDMLASNPPNGFRHAMLVFNDVDGKQIEVNGDLLASFRAATGTSLQAASLTKPITAHEVRKLVTKSHITLDDRLIELMSFGMDFDRDPRIAAIRVRDLLQHSAGFDRNISFDPLWRRDNIDLQQPDCPAAARYVLNRPLDFAPGERVSYSNVGYCLLGELLTSHGVEIESPSDHVLQQPLGAAGGWESTLPALHARLTQTLPLEHISGAAPSLQDGTHYDYGWRHWLDKRNGPAWTHFGRLPGILTVAATDGRKDLIVAYFDGDVVDIDGVSLTLVESVWRCMQITD